MIIECKHKIMIIFGVVFDALLQQLTFIYCDMHVQFNLVYLAKAHELCALHVVLTLLLYEEQNGWNSLHAKYCRGGYSDKA